MLGSNMFDQQDQALTLQQQQLLGGGTLDGSTSEPLPPVVSLPMMQQQQHQQQQPVAGSNGRQQQQQGLLCELEVPGEGLLDLLGDTDMLLDDRDLQELRGYGGTGAGGMTLSDAGGTSAAAVS
jgi:hypothetical protein